MNMGFPILDTYIKGRKHTGPESLMILMVSNGTRDALYVSMTIYFIRYFDKDGNQASERFYSRKIAVTRLNQLIFDYGIYDAKLTTGREIRIN